LKNRGLALISNNVQRVQRLKEEVVVYILNVLIKLLKNCYRRSIILKRLQRWILRNLKERQVLTDSLNDALF